MAWDYEHEDGNSAAGNQTADGLVYFQELARRHDLPHRMHGLENIAVTASGEARADAGSFVGRLFSDKAKAEKAVIKQLLNEISLREDLRKDIHVRIDTDICQCENLLHEIRTITEKKYFVPEESIAFGSRRTTLETKVLELEGCKREEDIESWRDLSTLRRYLLFALKDYWAAVRRRELLAFGQLGGNENLAV